VTTGSTKIGNPLGNHGCKEAKGWLSKWKDRFQFHYAEHYKRMHKKPPTDFWNDKKA